VVWCVKWTFHLFTRSLGPFYNL